MLLGLFPPGWGAGVGYGGCGFPCSSVGKECRVGHDLASKSTNHGGCIFGLEAT